MIQPPVLLSYLDGFPLSSLESILILFLFVVWIIYTAVVAYHWFVYGGFTHRGVPSIALHVVVSISFFLFAMSGIV
jgi:hypothetical protein